MAQKGWQKFYFEMNFESGKQYSQLINTPEEWDRAVEKCAILRGDTNEDVTVAHLGVYCQLENRHTQGQPPRFRNGSEYIGEPLCEWAFRRKMELRYGCN